MRQTAYSIAGGLIFTSLMFALWEFGEYTPYARQFALLSLAPGINILNYLQPACFGVPYADLKVFCLNAGLYSSLFWIGAKLFRSRISNS